jgi:uncharacterized protein
MRFISFSFVVAATAALVGCKKPEGAKLLYANNSVEAETGKLPTEGKANRLLNEQSAFLRKHAQDPVDWYPWGQDAFDLAKKENKPLLVSVGYASCPWSQKMQEESFTNAEIARFMNRHYINVLVDREERPDVNNAFLHFLFWRQKSSGWPMHFWLTPEGLPIFQGVYFPVHSNGPTAGWITVLEHVLNTWASGSDHIRKQAEDVAKLYRKEFDGIWAGAQLAGDPTQPEVIKFLTLPAPEQLSMLTKMSSDNLFKAVRALPANVLNDLWVSMKPADRLALIERIEPQSAAVLAVKLTGRERDDAFRRFVTGSQAMVYEKASSLYDPVNGGFSKAPKFIQPQVLESLMEYAIRQRSDRYGKQKQALDMVTSTIERLLSGGITDQLSGGFHRYATDAYWTLPQFEKMAYDQGMNAAMLVRASLATGRKDFLQAAERTLKYAIVELGHPGGGFYCAEGSSSATTVGAKELKEGAYYLWEKKEIDSLLGPDAAFATSLFGIEEYGNLPFDSPARTRMVNQNILLRQKSLSEMAKEFDLTPTAAAEKAEAVRSKLLEARRKRPRPTLDDKVLASWNGPIISALALAAWSGGDAALLTRAERAAEFILTKLRTADGALIHAFLDGPSNVPGFSEDYATIIESLLHLYTATGDIRWLKSAVELQERQLKDLWDAENGGFLDGPASPLLFSVVKSVDEATELAASSASVQNLITIASIINAPKYRADVRLMLERYGSQTGTSPISFLRMIRTAEMVLNPPQRIVVSGRKDSPDRAAVMSALQEFFLPNSVIFYMDGAEGEKFLTEKHPELAALAAPAGRTVVHVAKGAPEAGKPLTVDQTIATPGELRAWLSERYRVTNP